MTFTVINKEITAVQKVIHLLISHKCNPYAKINSQGFSRDLSTINMTIKYRKRLTRIITTINMTKTLT